MRKSAVQISLWDIYNGVSEAIEQHKPQLIRLLEEHIDFDRLIPVSFRYAFYRFMGRKHIYHLESFIRAFVVQKLLGISTDALLLSLLRLCAELRDFCGFPRDNARSRAVSQRKLLFPSQCIEREGRVYHEV